eukprot:1158574-Pelagomonas_calceolata.AAC.1
MVGCCASTIFLLDELESWHTWGFANLSARCVPGKLVLFPAIKVQGSFSMPACLYSPFYLSAAGEKVGHAQKQQEGDDEDEDDDGVRRSGAAFVCVCVFCSGPVGLMDLILAGELRLMAAERRTEGLAESQVVSLLLTLHRIPEGLAES